MSTSLGLGARLVRLPPVLLIAMLWAVLGLFDMVIASMSSDYAARMSETLVTALTGIVLSVLLYRVARRLKASSSRWALSWIALLAMLDGTILWWVNVLLQFWIGGHDASLHLTSFAGLDEYLVRLRYNWLYFTNLFVLLAVVFALLDYVKTLETRDRQLMESRLAALRLQLNPHFLFNTLNAIEAMVAEAGAEEAEQMIVRLSNFLRLSLSTETTGLVSLAFELDSVQAYMDIESVRFNDRLEVRYACDAGLADAQVPSLILQPLVENAIKYAVAPSKDPITVSIEAHAKGGELILSVVDNGQQAAGERGTSGTGVGLRNVAARLETLYGRNGGIETVKEAHGFMATIRLPLRWTET